MSKLEAISNYSQEAEKSLLGCILINPDLINTLDVTPDQFYILRNRQIWSAFNDIRRNGNKIDNLTLGEHLEKIGVLKDVGGYAYITELIGSVPTSLNAESYASIIREKAQRRNLMIIASDIAKISGDENKEIDTEIPGIIQRIVESSNIKNGAVPISEIMSKLYDEVESRAKNPKDIWGLKTNLPTFDEVTGGLQKGELMILSGEPGIGKSILAMQMAAEMGKATPGAIYSMEMNSLQVARRLVSARAEIPTRNIKTGKDVNWYSFTQAIEYFSNLPVYISESTGWSTTSLRADLARLKSQYKIEWFVLDYLYLLMDGKGYDEIERTSLASKGMKNLAKDLNLAGVAVHSMNKTGMDADKNGKQNIPTQASLRGSGQVVYDADLIVFLTKYKSEIDDIYNSTPKQDQENVRVLWFGKGRELENPRKFIKLVKRPGFPAFAEYSKERK